MSFTHKMFAELIMLTSSTSVTTYQTGPNLSQILKINVLSLRTSSVSMNQLLIVITH
jgi:hypothetical protein